MSYYLKHFGLHRDPFSKEIDGDEVWLPPLKVQVVDDLCHAIVARQWALLTAEPGAGKTTVLRAVRHRMRSERVRLTYCHNTTLGRRDFYRQICHALGLNPKATAAGVFNEITTHINELRNERIHPVFIIDEAHLLKPAVLKHLHILGNYEWDSLPLLTVVLVGLPELQEQLALRAHRSLYSRISRRLRIQPLQPRDTAEYLRHRLALAGCDRDLFESGALALLHEAADGILRDLDRLANAAMRHAAAADDRLVGRDAVVVAIRNDNPTAF